MLKYCFLLNVQPLHDPYTYQTNIRRKRKPQKNEESIFPPSSSTHLSGDPSNNHHTDYGNVPSASFRSAPTLANWEHFGAIQNPSAIHSDMEHHVFAERAAFAQQHPPLQRTGRPGEPSKGPSSR